MKPIWLGTIALVAVAVALRPEHPTVRAAKELLGTLSETQRVAAVVPFTSSQRFEWAYVPLNRKGVSWAEMSDVQRKAGENLLRTVLSEEGYRKTDGIRQLELVLRQLENNNMGRDPEKYWFAFYGEPSSADRWGFRYEGHHLSLTFAFDKGQMVASTPQFLGSNPGEVRQGPKTGTALLRKEQDLGYALLESLTPEQRAAAIVSAEAPADIVTGNKRNASLDHHDGVSTKGFSSAQKRALEALLKAHAEVQTSPEQKRRLARALGDPEVKFAWLGSAKRGEKHYYRIQGSRFLIEYDNTQNDANHIHAVWRDFSEDFGGDALADHYQHSHSH